MRNVIRSVLIAIIAPLLALIIGAYCGSAFGYGIAFVSDRDPAELKDMLIWCMIGTSLVFATGAIWGAAQYLGSKRWVKILAGVMFVVATLASVGITTLAYMEAPRYGRR